MVASDSKKRWPEGLLDDPRVREFWDAERVVGRWFAGKPQLGDCGLGGDVAWDAYYFFPPEARWADVPQPMISSGCPVVRARGRLQADVDAVAAEAKKRRR